MDEKAKDEVQKIMDVVDSSIKGILSKVPCAHCGKETDVLRKAVFAKNKFVMVLNTQDGHLLQAETIGGTLTNLAKMFKARARDMGVKIEVLIPSIKFRKNSIRIEVMSVLVGTQPTTETGEVR